MLMKLTPAGLGFCCCSCFLLPDALYASKDNKQTNLKKTVIKQVFLESLCLFSLKKMPAKLVVGVVGELRRMGNY